MVVDPATEVLRDAQGRQILFHGVNVVYKEHPYIPAFGRDDEFDDQESLVAFDMANLQKWGMNHVRLGVMWEAVETGPGVYN